jgi:serine/threonine protein kinase
MLDGGHGKLSDLGLSRILAPGLTITGLGSAASVEYLDPALIRGDLPSRATDIFSLGATLHRVVAGIGLYGSLPSDNTMVAMRRVLSKDAVISERLRPEVREVIAAAISEDPGRRPATALELSERIDWLAAAA